MKKGRLRERGEPGERDGEKESDGLIKAAPARVSRT
jgi:hypothetical protein